MINKIVKGKQCTILWHVDELNISHVDSDIFYRVLYDIDTEYENISKMTITRGNINKYFGITINYSLPVKVKFSMVNYIGKIVDDIPENKKGGSETPAAHHLFDISEDATKMYQTDTELFSSFFSVDIVYVKAIAPIHTVVSFILMN